MKKLFVGIVAFAVVAILIAVIIPMLKIGDDSTAVGSVSIAESYRATTTRDFNGTALPSLSVLKNGQGQLGSVVITGAGAGVINIYDATSTVTNTLWATTTIATIPASAAAGTYTFDAGFSQGLMYEIIGTAPTSTITFK